MSDIIRTTEPRGNSGTAIEIAKSVFKRLSSYSITRVSMNIPTASTRRLAIVSSTSPVTVSTFHRELLRQLLEHYDVCVISSSGHHMAQLAAAVPIETRTIEMAREISIVRDFRALCSWVKFLWKKQPRLIITATPKASLLGQLAAWLTGVESRIYYLGGLRLEGESGFRRHLLEMMERLAMAASSRIVVNSPSLAARCIELDLAPRSKIGMTVPGSSHGVDSAHFAPAPWDNALGESLNLDPAYPVIGFVGRLTKDKGINTLIEAMSELSKRSVHAQLLIVGPQDEVDSEAYLARLEATPGNIAVVGQVGDVRPYFGLIDVHVLPSLREGFPNVVLEASSMGIPTVTTDATGSVDSVIHGETGLIVPVGDGDALADAIQRLLDDAVLRGQLGSQARRWACENFDPGAIVRSLLCAAGIPDSDNIQNTVQPRPPPRGQSDGRRRP